MDKQTGKNLQCLQCNTSFYAPNWWIKTGAKYCSRQCYWKNKHDEPWNKGTKGLIKPNSGNFIKIGINFEGTLEEYKSLHYRIGMMLGKPSSCQNCGKSGLKGKLIHWANISGEYKEIKEDWIRLCVKCHFEFDNQEKRRAKNAGILFQPTIN